MKKEDLIWLASKAFDKKWNFETLKYGDALYGKESLAENVWIYVVECINIGRVAFYEKYKQYKLY